MSDLVSVISRAVQDAFRAWSVPAQAEGTARRTATVDAVSIRPVRFVSLEELEEVAEAALDLDEQVKREVARTPGAQPVGRRTKLHRSRPRRVA